MLEADVIEYYKTHQIEGPRLAVVTAAASAACCTALFLVLQSGLLARVYIRLGRAERTARADLNQRLLEVVAALVTTISGIYAFAASDCEDVQWLLAVPSAASSLQQR
ncbi:hypothetical protein WJX72_004400 [[Myrmecia] bisecta]|uniref:Uncharacterized protein n=1 Tax=[Myrmecia] bisecta TaxID=41462 RepID=A0AAW1QQD1_9CHLO